MTIDRAVRSLAVLLALAPITLAAQITADEHAARRDALAARMGTGAVIAYGAPNVVDLHSEFRQLPSFEYLTGFHEPDAAMVLVNEGGEPRTTLFTPEVSVRTQLYDGFRADPAELSRRTGMAVRPLDELEAFVDSLAAAGVPLFELRDVASSDYAAQDSLTRGGQLVERLSDRHPGVEIGSLNLVVARMRARKSADEVALLRRAIDITEAAHLAALEVVRPGAWEYEVEAAIEHAFRSRGADGPAFASIVGSGPNATTLHYMANDTRMEDGDVVVMDIGAQVEGYDADVTRTVPVSGRFSPEQRAIYDIVLEAQKAAEERVRPGGRAGESLRASIEVRLEGLARLGLIESADARYDPPWPVDCNARPDQCMQGMLFMIHGISHGIGLEVHDPAQFYFDGVYRPGDVFTIEPGIYIDADVFELLPDTPRNRAFIAAAEEAVRRYQDVGVRIEDDYLVTETGVERLSVDAPREAEAIEAAMARARGGGTQP